MGVSLLAGRAWVWQNMAVSAPYAVAIVLDDAQRDALSAVARRPTAAFRQVMRARIVLAAAGGACNTAIAEDLRLHVDTVRTWRGRFARQGMALCIARAAHNDF